MTLRSRYLLPGVDFLNHEHSPFLQVLPEEASRQGAAGTRQGAAVSMSIKRDEGVTVWQVARHVQKGAGVTWTYGALSTMDLVLSYGFVPEVCVLICVLVCALVSCVPVYVPLSYVCPHI